MPTDIADKTLNVTPHTIAAVMSSAIVITAFVVGTYVSTRSQIEAVSSGVAELRAEMVKLQAAGSDDRYRGKDADRNASVLWSLNREKYPDLKIPIPTSVRDGQIEVFR